MKPVFKKFTCQIKEKGNNHILTPVYIDNENCTWEYVEDFFGLHKPNVEWFKITEEVIEP